MKNPFPRRADRHPPCADLHADDGVAPRRLLRKPSSEKLNRKDRQLAAQVFEALALAVPSYFTRDEFGDVMVDSVTPAPNASRMRITFRIGGDPSAFNATMARLLSLRGVLRTQVAQSVQRKRAPELDFICLPPEVTP